MRRDTVNYTVVGSFVLLMLVVLGTVLMALTGRGGPADEYYVVYRNVTGLVPGTPVSYEGYQIGQVERVAPEPDGGKVQYRVEFSVTKGWPIAADSVARITASGLLSAVSIDIQQGRSEQLLQPGQALAGRESADLFGAINDVAGDVRDLIERSVRPLLDNLNRHLETLASSVEQNTTAVLQDLRMLTGKLNQSADLVQSMLSDGNRAHVTSFLSNANTLSTNLVQLSGDMRRVTTELERLLGDVGGVVAENRGNLKSSMQDLRTSMRAVAQHVNAVSYHLEGTSRNLHEFSQQIRQNPGLLLGSTPPADRVVRQR